MSKGGNVGGVAK